MRTLIAGLLLVLLGIAGAEYLRRHPETAEAKKAEPDSPGQAAALKAAPTVTQLTTSDETAGAPNVDSKPIDDLLASTAVLKAADGSTSVLSGHFKMRELHTGPDFGVVVLEKDKSFALVRVSKAAPAKVLATRSEPIAAVAVDGDSVVWGEAGFVLSTPANGGAIKTLAHFSAGTVLGVAAFKGTVLVALNPRDADPFSTDAVGAIVRVGAGAPVVVAKEQVRPHDLLVDGSEGFWVAGYPAWLNRGSLDGSFSAKIAERADGPLAFDGDLLVHRYPQSTGPEVRRMARAGGSVQTLARADVDWLTAGGGSVAYTTSGLGPRLYEVKAGGEPVERVAFKGVAKGLAKNADGLWLMVTDDEGVTTISVY